MVKGDSMAFDKEFLIELICKHCEFYKESEKDLECGAFKILKGLLEKGVITPEEIADVLRS
jgi:hypothetical protein